MPEVTQPRTPTEEVADDTATMVQNARYQLWDIHQLLIARKPKRRNAKDPRPETFRAAEVLIRSAQGLLEDAEKMLNEFAGLE